MIVALLCLVVCTATATGCARTLVGQSENRVVSEGESGRDEPPANFDELLAESGGGSPVDQLSMGRVAEKRRMLAEAATIYRDVMAQQPDNPLPVHRLGVIMARQGKFPEAHSFFATALKLAPDDVALLSDTGYACYLDNRLEDAERFLLQAVALEPDHKASCNNLGLVYGAQERYAESLEMFRRERGEAQAQANLGYVLAQHGEFEGAQNSYLRALTLDQTLRPAAEAMLQVAARDEIRRTALDHDPTKPAGDAPQQSLPAEVASIRTLPEGFALGATLEQPQRLPQFAPAQTVRTASYDVAEPVPQPVPPGPGPAAVPRPFLGPPASHWPAVPAIQSPIGAPAAYAPFSLNPPETATPIPQPGTPAGSPGR